MDSNLAKSALLNTSASTDVLRSGGKVSITDLLSFDIDNLLTAGQKIYRAEVQQVAKVALGSIALTANTRYSIRVGNVLNEYEGGHDSLREYAWTSGPDPLGPTADDVADGIVAAINNTDPRNKNDISATNPGKAVQITDDAGYYPIRPAGRAGPSTVTLGDNVLLGVITIETAGVIAYGDGTYILSNIPVRDPMTGNLISGELNTPSGAVAGQFYSGFHMTYTKEVNHQAVTGLRAEKVLRQLIYIDNGAGASTANAAGYEAFKTEFERLIYDRFEKDPNAMVEFWESVAILCDDDGVGVPTNGDTDVNVLNITSNQLHYICIGATPADPLGSDLSSPGGFRLMRKTMTDDMGEEYSAPVGVLSPQEFVVGKEAFSFKAQINIALVAKTDDFLVGLRKKEDYEPAVDNYADMAALNVISGDITMQSILNGAATISEDTGVNWADDETHTLEIQVNTDGVCKYLVDDVDYSGEMDEPFILDADEVMIPFIYHLSDGTATSNVILLQKWFSIADTLDY